MLLFLLVLVSEDTLFDVAVESVPLTAGLLEVDEEEAVEGREAGIEGRAMAFAVAR